jgi:phage shock protein E
MSARHCDFLAFYNSFYQLHPFKNQPMSTRISTAACLSALLLAALATAQEATHTKDTLADVKKNVDSGKAIIVDVREQNEWDAGHLKGAILMPRSKLQVDAELAGLLKQLPKDKVIYTHCRAGGRALACGEILKKCGYDVRPLKPGYDDLIQAGFEKAEK